MKRYDFFFTSSECLLDKEIFAKLSLVIRKKNIDDFDFRFFGLDLGSKNCFLNFQHGIASSIGEQPVKGLLNPAAGARMSVAEALSNLVFAKISSLNVRIFYF